MMVPYICLSVLSLSFFGLNNFVTATSDGLPHTRQSPSASSSLHWPAIVGADDRSRRTVGNIDGRLERSLFASGGACSEQSEISENTIIRTKDSRALGARFLNETSLGPDARDRCLNLCCSFHGCNVAVYEEKDGGNCYLFDCGPPEEFRCKFTSHSRYTSGVIRRRENAHEEELTQLKKISIAVVTPPQPPVTDVIITNPPTSSTVKPTRSCSRYQFECHTTGECIAIYNACDGIIQCSDGSDEAPELGCPATTTESTTMKTFAPTQPLMVNKVPVEMPLNSVIDQHPSFEWRSRNRDRYEEREPSPVVDMPVKPDPRSEANHWRTPLEPNSKNYPADRMHQIYQPNMGEALPYQAEQDRSLGPYYDPENSRHYGASWREQQDRNLAGPEYRVNAYGDRYYDKEGRLPYDANSNVYSGNKKHDWDRNKPIQRDNIPVSNSIESRPVPPVPNVEENPRTIEHGPGLEERRPLHPAAPTASEERVTQHPTTPTSTTSTLATTSIKSKTPALVTKHEAAVNHAHIHHFGVNQADFREERAERSRQTVGAAWALTLGLSVTAVLVLLVGCRLRSLKKHLRRGRGGHARDADYLVNGMYL